MAKYSYEELIRRTGSIYETVNIMSQRARQVNDEQKASIDAEKEYIPSSDIRDAEDFDDVEIDREALNRDRIKYAKPTTIALDELVSNQLEHYYIEPDGNPAK
ncbi:DNA-directed RNA polymerase subunit omega [bacterium]|nr:DNA-directed RNA polymerase subunit omega [bacterium]